MKIDEVLQLDRQFSKNDWMWNVNNDSNLSSFSILKNKWKIIISAPHTVKHIREWKILPQDSLTWWIALYLWNRLELPVIYSTSYKVWDPNFDDNNKSVYKQTLVEYINKNDIKFLIDLHWCWLFRDFCIELGTWWMWDPHLLWHNELINIIAKSLNDDLKSYIERSKRNITKNTLFSASSETTVSSYISKCCSIPTIQIEINKELRNTDSPKYLSLLINALENMIKNIAEFF